MTYEKGSARIGINLRDGRITVRNGAGNILHEGYAKDGTWDALWVVIRGMVGEE